MSTVASDVDALFANTSGCAHVVHLYEKEDVFLDTLEGFTNGGLRAGEVVVLIATGTHLFALEQRLQESGWDVAALREHGHYIAVDAAQALAGFMRDGRVDEQLFEATVVALVDAAREGGKRVRTFGEMVALLWAAGNREATHRLEVLWNNLCRDRSLSLLCAYPRQQPEPDEVMHGICALHDQVLVA